MRPVQRTRLLALSAVSVTVMLAASAQTGQFPLLDNRAKPAGAEAISGYRALVVGDSLTVGSTGALLAAGGSNDIEVGAMGGMQTGPGVAFVQRHDLSGLAVLVVALGTNDWFANQGADMDDKIDSMMAAAGSLPVVWVNVDTGAHMADAGAVNAALYAATTRYPNLSIADWSNYFAAVPGHENMLAPDGIHYTEEGYRIRGAWLAGVMAERVTKR